MIKKDDNLNVGRLFMALAVSFSLIIVAVSVGAVLWFERASAEANNSTILALNLVSNVIVGASAFYFASKSVNGGKPNDENK